MKRVVITGAGAVTPLGNDAPSTWRSLCAGRSGVGPFTLFDASSFPVRIAAQVRDFDVRAAIPAGLGPGRLGRAGRFGVAAALEALRDAGTEPGTYTAEACGVALGASVGRPDLQFLADIGVLRRRTGRPDAFLRQPPRQVLADNQNLALSVVAQALDARGPAIGTSTACSGSGHAIGEAYRCIQEGDAELMVAGGHDSLTTWCDLLGFSLLGAMTSEWNDDPERASRPFDADRSGFVVGEGGVAFVLEERERALERGARVLAELVGYGSTLNAWRITDSPPDGSGAVQAMEAAIAESGLGPTAIDYVVAHGTGTPGNDLSETVAIKKVFGDHAHRLVISSPKSMAGHLTAAGAGLNLLAAIGAIRESVVPPTVNLDTPDRRLDLDYVPRRARNRRVTAALVNAFAFGGTNTGLIVAEHREDT
ncbi:beta-ketoacyl-[acyl-carrier-protein] synthase family protein [Streptomyces griseorubiginosus]|uniref:beta-ketoacyl-[acyl-carrier-protein] synthase family protein n=1 Tax=Streptomyces griseorubiginosus TaxID=67304 RepID=UPI001AD73397|nr:beta-ketoacyl-[acyl-carrier-protein] synthase family protein [Streptomyces griseorubiginosus]MBO4254043.1 beta-ketoacyl-ACP synthase II [Streptomyces griseorubiginosus]